MKLVTFSLYFIMFIFSYTDIKAQIFDNHDSINVYNVQMHVHGHSHHNASDKPGSVQWHTHQAQKNNVDVIWFTEHDGMLNQSQDFIINFDEANVNQDGNISFNRVSNFLPEYLEIKQSNGSGIAEVINDSTVFFQLKHLFGQEAELSISPRIAKGKLAGFRLPRPISSMAELKFNMKSQFGGKNNVFKVIVALSWHITNIPHKQSIEYIISDTVQSKSYLINETGIIQYFIPAINDQTNHYSLDLFNDALNLRYGGDNTITDIQFVLSCKNASTINASVSNIKLSSKKTEPENQMRMIQEFSNSYESGYTVKGISGIEYSPFRENDHRPHFNLFFPNSELTFHDIVSVFPYDKFDYYKLIDQVHSMGGLVSFNHIFGTSIGSSGQFSVGMQKTLVDSMATYYMEQNLYNSDILEVGYITRGGVNLDNHLKIWDIFTSNGFFLFGNGTTDAHGGIWETELPNPFTTWIWSENSMDTSILKALNKGRFYFGTFQNKIKKFFFSINEYKMGDRIYSTNQTGTLKILLDPIPNNYTYRLIQGAIDYPGNEVNYIENITFDPVYPPVLDLKSSCFIRIEIESISDGIKLFSNPIILLKENNSSHTIYSTKVNPQSEDDSELNIFDPYPNPATNEVWIPFELNVGQNLTFNIINTNGEIVNKIFLGNRSKGKYLSKLAGIYWNLKTYSGNKVNPGVYFIVAENSAPSSSKKIIVK